MAIGSPRSGAVEHALGDLFSVFDVRINLGDCAVPPHQIERTGLPASNRTLHKGNTLSAVNIPHRERPANPPSAACVDTVLLHRHRSESWPLFFLGGLFFAPAHLDAVSAQL